jgi:hypothetical protein
MADDDFRKQERPSRSKPFAVDIQDLAGYSKNETYEKI